MSEKLDLKISIPDIMETVRDAQAIYADTKPRSEQTNLLLIVIEEQIKNVLKLVAEVERLRAEQPVTERTPPGQSCYLCYVQNQTRRGA